MFNIAINYGARAEIASAVNALIAEGRRDIVPDDISSRLYTAGMPDPDLIIRTGGEYRLSNFLLWQAAYSELVIRPEYWPDFTPEVFEEAISEYQRRDRRFGGVK